ncbi:glycosyltransferase family 4 protein ['Paenibacillus yunnanensis' Narsing Rao et al. 2020]|uniref:glycosyltransferase family 4 protein n=1 Tax=Paenibacillus tengchongensis TaxID=2608684 RepID=UPI00124C09AF|nr:glycosyltransferase family 4 protein [Paenibacillus tengchongensis]
MRITFPILTLSRGGAQRMLAELANRMFRLGHEVTVVMPSQTAVEYPLECPVVFSAEEELSEVDFPYGDIIVSNYYTTVPVAQRASEQGRGIHVRLALCYEPTFLPGNNQSFASYHRVKHLMVLSRWQQETVRLNHGIKGRIIPIGVDAGFYNMHLRDQVRNPVVSAIMRKPEGGFSGHREQEYLLEQLGTVKALHPEVTVFLLTPPGEFASSSVLQALRTDPRFQLRTPSGDEELCYHYNEADIFVSSSTYDTGSMPGLEAMRCGAALVTVYSGGNLEYCRHGQNCLMSYRHENRLAADIAALIGDRDLRGRLALRGEQDSARYTWERSVEIFQNELYEIVAKQA